MRIRPAGSLIVLIAALSAVTVPAAAGAAHAAAAAAACSQAGYSHNNSVCAVVPSHGSFSLKVPGTSKKLNGKGSSGTEGTQVTVTKVAPPVPSKGGIGIKVQATGKFGALHISSGKLWKFNASKSSLKHVTAVTSPGVYQVTK